MRLTIVKDDNLVILEKHPIKFDLTPFNLPKNFHALQWYNEQGEEEFNDGTPNKKITSLNDYHSILDEYMRLADIEDTQPEPTETEKFNSLVNQRNSYLSRTDWIILRHNEQSFHPEITCSISDIQYLDLLMWRQILRELPEIYKTSDKWQWPDAPAYLVPKYLNYPDPKMVV